MKKKKKELSAQYITKIMSVFESNNWEIEDSENSGMSHFNRFCDRIKNIEKNEQRDLMLELSKRYLWISDEEYYKYLKDALIKLIGTNPQIKDKSKFYVTQLIAPSDEGKIKSSARLVYLFNDSRIRFDQTLSKYKFEIINGTENLESILKETDAILILADDFIGTGKTAEKALQKIKLLNIPDEKICVLALVAQEQGLEYLKKYKIFVVAKEIRKKGISDYYLGQELKKNSDIMSAIEKRLSVKSDFKFGYERSESLVTMIRTPNNTFPVFWHENENANMNLAPFPRY